MFQDIPEFVAGYFNFIIDYAAKPGETCSKYKSLNKVDKDLLTYAAIGSAFTWLIFRLISKLGEVYNDKSDILDLADKIEIDKLPLIILPSIVLLSLFVHVAVRLTLIISRQHKNLEPNTVNFKNTVNGALAFFSFAPFAYMLINLLTLLLTYNFVNLQDPNYFIVILLLLPTILLFLSFVIWYFPVSVSSVQPEDLRKIFMRAIYIVYAFFFVLFFAVGQIREIVSR